MTPLEFVNNIREELECPPDHTTRVVVNSAILGTVDPFDMMDMYEDPPEPLIAGSALLQDEWTLPDGGLWRAQLPMGYFFWNQILSEYDLDPVEAVKTAAKLIRPYHYPKGWQHEST